ncbi:uncharacterized protein TRUGW13939_02881 [Talaromyces rugulosus]|uniref:SUZ-C domain-containing protein n=1 Tax=Talaromyces rugulosus TaxID=121627 RepID=A0A7H8QRM3_TALRU|nr:uncharacterized protein TRUGW13939_02881 [Talaromyces rugulosus]QKX55783.1 hypothetical protein TRUGW13939_02881 [Talaromyces rugulosus]
MSAEQNNVPDAWETDWEMLADKQDQTPESADKKVSSKVTKAQRRAAQAEFNRQLWAEADAPQTFHYLESKADVVPLKQEFKPAVTVLSRRPQMASRNGDAATAGLSALNLGPDGKELYDSDEEANKAPEMTPEERHAKALKDREEKQRKYEEVRERLFGNSSTPGSGASSPGGTPPPSRHQSSGGEGNRGRGRNRGGGRDRDNSNREKRDSPGASNNNMGKQRQLYDPNYAAKSNSTYLQRRDRPQQSSTERSDTEQQVPKQPIRNPRGPDSNGRGGFGFGPRGRGA